MKTVLTFNNPPSHSIGLFFLFLPDRAAIAVLGNAGFVVVVNGKINYPLLCVMPIESRSGRSVLLFRHNIKFSLMHLKVLYVFILNLLHKKKWSSRPTTPFIFFFFVKNANALLLRFHCFRHLNRPKLLC